jgi:hypothetical protein
MKVRLLTSGLVLLALVVVGLGLGLYFGRPEKVTAAPNVFASPIHAGCYIAAAGDCRIHTEPLSIDIAAGSKLARFTLVAINMGTGVQTKIYDFRPDISNPLPTTGTIVNLSQVAQDFGVSCGKSYQISFQGSDTLDGTSIFNLGQTNTFTCPTTLP